MASSCADNHCCSLFLYAPAVSRPRRQHFILSLLLYTWLSNCPVTITPFVKKTVSIDSLLHFCDKSVEHVCGVYFWILHILLWIFPCFDYFIDVVSLNSRKSVFFSSIFLRKNSIFHFFLTPIKSTLMSNFRIGSLAPAESSFHLPWMKRVLFKNGQKRWFHVGNCQVHNLHFKFSLGKRIKQTEGIFGFFYF